MARVLRVLAILSILILAIIPIVTADVWNYTTNGTYYWNNTENLTAITLDIVGGGGAGAAGKALGGYGGHAGEHKRVVYIEVLPCVNYTLIVGEPGINNTVLGEIHSGSPSSAFGIEADGGLGGNGLRTGIDTGEDGENGFWNSTLIAFNGTSSTYAGGTAGVGYGAGGGGGGSDNFANTFDGGGGASGFIRIWEYGTASGNTPMFHATTTSEKPGTAIKFIDESVITNTTELTYLWDFGDGGTSNTTGDVNHVYSYTGIYTVSLTVSSEEGAVTETKTDYITITSVNYYDPNNPPKSVRFHIQTLWGMPLPGATVSALGITTSTGSWDWVVTLLGIPLDEVGINGTAMTDTTDSNGNIEFLMIPSAKYNVTTTLDGYSFPVFYVTPHDTQYNIVAALNGTGWFETGNDTLSQVNVTVQSVKLNDTYGQINISYYDAGGTTTGGAINITKDNTTRGGADVLVESFPITGNEQNVSTVVEIPQEGIGYKVAVDANPYGAPGPDIKAIRSFAVWFKGTPVALAGFSPTILLWFSIFLLIFTAMFAGATHAPQMAIVVCVEAWVLFSMGWLDPLEDNMWVGQNVLMFTLAFATLMAIVWNFREGKRKEKGT